MTREQVKPTQVDGTQEKVSSLMERKNMNNKNQKVVVKFLPATQTKGARYSVKGNQGRKILDFNYAAREPEAAAVYEYMVETTGQKKWSIMEFAQAGKETFFWVYSVLPVELTKHKSIVEDYSWTR